MRGRDLRTPLALFAAALLVRALPLASVFSEGEVFLRDGDAYYHLRRILFTIHDFPQPLVFDSYVQFPHGAKVIWPVFLDVLFAALLWPFAQLGGFALVERAAAWLPPVLGALTVVAAWAVARRNFGPQAALWAGVLACVLGGHFVYSQLGALDHHVAVSLVSVLLLGSVLRCLSAGAEGTSLRDALALGGLAGVALLVWPGAILYAALALGGLAGAALFEADRTRAAHQWRALAWSAACACAVVAPFSLGAEWPQWSAMSPVVLSNFQPWLLGSAALLALATATAGARVPGLSGSGGRALLFVAGGIALLVVSLLASPDLREGFSDAWRWLGKREAFQASVVESQGLFVVRGRVAGYMATRQLTPLVYVFPLLWLVGAWSAVHAERRGPRVFLLVWSAALFGVTLMQKRFLDTFSIAFALQVSVSAEALWRRVGAAPGGLLERCATLGAVLLLVPLYPNYTPHLDNVIRALQDEPLTLSTYHRANRIMVGVSRWLRTYTPRTSGWLDARAKPEYGVMAPWNSGHLIQQVARRPTVTDNFGDDAGEENFALEQRFWAVSSQESDRILEKLRVRYVVATDGDPRQRSYDLYSTYRTLFQRDGSALVATEGGASARANGRHRLLMESQRLNEKARRSFAKVFEFVPGARIRGRTQPGRPIGISVRVETNRGRRFHYRDRQVSDADGSFEFRVPYANSGGPDSIDVGASYSLRCGLLATPLTISEAQIMGGQDVPVEDPCSAPPTEKRGSPAPKPRRRR